jgi:hypothetical protein
MDYGAIDALPNPGYGPAAGMQDDDILVQKMGCDIKSIWP